MVKGLPMYIKISMMNFGLHRGVDLYTEELDIQSNLPWKMDCLVIMFH